MGMTVKERLDQHDKQIKAIRELVHEGMRLVIQSRKDVREIHAMHKSLGAKQDRTEAMLQDLVGHLKKGGGNGHNKQKLDM